MDNLTFFAEVIKAATWPVTVIIVVLLFRHQLSALLARIRKGKVGSTEFEFEREVEALSEQAPQAQLSLSNADAPTVSLVTANPRGGVLDAWNGIESDVHRLAYKLQISPSATSRSTVGMVREIENRGKLNPDDVSLFNNLRMLRNRAVHEPDFSPSPESVLMFQKLAQDLKGRLDRALNEP